MAGHLMEATEGLTAALAVVALTMALVVAVLTTVSVVGVSSEPSCLAGQLDYHSYVLLAVF